MKSLFFVLPSATKVRELIFPPFPFRNFPGKKLFTPPAIGRTGAFFFRSHHPIWFLKFLVKKASRTRSRSFSVFEEKAGRISRA